MAVILLAQWIKERYHAIQYKRTKDVFYYKLFFAVQYIGLGLIIAIAISMWVL
jgi:hypothetical protein